MQLPFCIVLGDNENVVFQILLLLPVHQLNDEDRRNFLDLFAALVRNDGRQIGRLMIERNSKNNLTGQPLTQKQFELFQERMHDVVSQVHESGLALGRISIGDLCKKSCLRAMKTM